MMICETCRAGAHAPNGCSEQLRLVDARELRMGERRLTERLDLIVAQRTDDLRRMSAPAPMMQFSPISV